MTEYKEGNHNEFIQFLFSSEPKEKGEILFESPLEDKNKNIHLHIFEQLLMIFVDGLKYFHGDNNGKVTISELTKDNIEKVINKLTNRNMNHQYTFKSPSVFENYQGKF